MTPRDAAAKLDDCRRRVAELRREMRALHAAAQPEEVCDYEFATIDGSRRLSSLFGAKRDLIMIHNMGVSCPNCTLWADGYNGIYDHLIARAAFVVSSPDPPEVQQVFAASRGWRFLMVSHHNTSFAADMGYRSEIGSWLPGISVFRIARDRIVRTATAPSDLGDDYCALWHLFDLLPDGRAGFRAQLGYPQTAI